MKILVTGDTRGRWDVLPCGDGSADICLHVGALGLLDGNSKVPLARERHLQHFSPFNKNGQTGTLTQLDKFLDGSMKIPVPMYAIPSSSDDPSIVTSFRNSRLSIPNLNLVDDYQPRYIDVGDGLEVLVCGLPGFFAIHRLFQHSSSSSANHDDKGDVLPMSGDAGDLWMSILHIGLFLQSMYRLSEKDNKRYSAAIKIFLSNGPPSREPLIHHLAIMLKMDYIVAGGVFPKQTASWGNILSNVSLEEFKQKFISAKNKLDELVEKFGEKYRSMLNAEQQKLYDLAIETWNTIPSSRATVGTLSKSQMGSLQRNINDLYHSAFHNEWHINVSDPEHGYALLDFHKGRVALKTVNKGVDFNYRQIE